MHASVLIIFGKRRVGRRAEGEEGREESRGRGGGETTGKRCRLPVVSFFLRVRREERRRIISP